MITRQEFRQHAKALPVEINGVRELALAKEFSTGSLGWNLNGRGTVTINGQEVPVQIGLNVTIIGSKELPAGSNGEAAPARK